MICLGGNPAAAEDLTQVPEQAASFRLTWDAPPECANEREFRRDLTKLIPKGLSGAGLTVDGSVKKKEGIFELDLVVRDRTHAGKRHFQSTSCAEVSGAAAVAIALLLQSRDVDETAGTAQAGDASARDARASAAADQASVPSVQQGEDPSSPLQVVIALPTATVDVGVLPFAQVGLSFGAGVQRRALRVLASAEWRPRADLLQPDNPAVGAHVDRAAVRLEGCYVRPLTTLSVAGCATLGLEYLRAEGFGTAIVPRAADSFWLGVGGALGASYALTPHVAIAAQIGAELETSRPKLVVEGLGTFGQVSWVNLRGRAGIEWIF